MQCGTPPEQSIRTRFPLNPAREVRRGCLRHDERRGGKLAVVQVPRLGVGLHPRPDPDPSGPLTWLSMVHEFTPECLPPGMGRRTTSDDVVDAAMNLLCTRGAPPIHVPEVMRVDDLLSSGSVRCRRQREAEPEAAHARPNAAGVRYPDAPCGPPQPLSVARYGTSAGTLTIRTVCPSLKATGAKLGGLMGGTTTPVICRYSCRVTAPSEMSSGSAQVPSCFRR